MFSIGDSGKLEWSGERSESGEKSVARHVENRFENSKSCYYRDGTFFLFFFLSALVKTRVFCAVQFRGSRHCRFYRIQLDCFERTV